jgi:predicted acylesterase/phospholipase RssA
MVTPRSRSAADRSMRRGHRGSRFPNRSRVRGLPPRLAQPGTSLSGIVAGCVDALRPASPAPTADGPAIGLTLSGGGFRATFAAVGVVRYLADSGLLGNLRHVSSVSGGSFANDMLRAKVPSSTL